MIASNIDLPRRYPGLKPFERNQQAVFHGRQDDVQRLANLILRERLVVLFAKSGIGKTSLLKAGVAPELERQDYVPILLRTDRTDKPLLEIISATLNSSPELAGRDATGTRPDKPQTLWEQLKRLEFDLNGLPATPVLVFDQFEETFTLTHNEKSRSQFLTELADVANGTMPEELRAELLSDFHNGAISMEEMHWWEEQPDLRIVLSIRSDLLHMLESMSGRIPGILKNRYHLLPLDRDKARVAIVMPAQADGEYSSPKFQYSEPALEEMIDFLAGNDSEGPVDFSTEMHTLKRNDDIETVNLQIVCMDVEERIIDFQKQEGFEVTPDFYSGKDGLRSSIRNFYTNQLDAFPKAYVERILQKSQQGVYISDRDKELADRSPQELRDLAQRLIEESLITPGNRRNSVVDDSLLTDYHVTTDFLDTLVDKSRLLRKEPRLDDFFYEISHDTLLKVIIESRTRRREKEQSDEEKAAYEAKLAEEAQRREAVEKELRTTRRQRQLARTVAFLSFVSLLISIAFGIWFIRDYITSARDQLKTAESNVKIEQYDAALNGYRELLRKPSRVWILENSNPPKQVGWELAVVDSLHHAYSLAHDSLLLGDDLMIDDQYSRALSTYRTNIILLTKYKNLVLKNPVAIKDSVLTPRVDTNQINKQILLIEQRKANAFQTLVKEFKISQRDYEVFREAGVWGQAMRNMEKMKSLLPENANDAIALQRELQMGMPVDLYVSNGIEECQRHMR